MSQNFLAGQFLRKANQCFGVFIVNYSMGLEVCGSNSFFPFFSICISVHVERESELAGRMPMPEKQDDQEAQGSSIAR
jgi:hypothetical protein